MGFKWAQKARQEFCGQPWHLLWEKMPGIDRLALDDTSAIHASSTGHITARDGRYMTSANAWTVRSLHYKRKN
jgi:hypothetical protein